jgi:hypothetical protein
MKQTAVDYLSEKYNYITWLRNRDEISAGRADELRADAYVQAKEMEKQQILDAHMEGHYVISYPVSPELEAEKYYNETFNTK